MEKTKQQIFEALKNDIKKRHETIKKTQPKSDKDVFAGLVANLKKKQMEQAE